MVSAVGDARCGGAETREAELAALRAYRLTRTALPPVLPTRMPPQSFEFWTDPLTQALRDWKQRLSGRRSLPGTADLEVG